MDLKKLPIRSLVFTHSKCICDLLIGNLPDIRLRGFLDLGTICQNNQAGVSKKVVSTLKFLTVCFIENKTNFEN